MVKLTSVQQRLVMDNRGIAIRVLKKLGIRRGAAYEEAEAEAMLALCLAARGFDASKAKFSTWAWLKVDGHLKDWMERVNRHGARTKVTEEVEQTPEPTTAALQEAILYAKQIETALRKRMGTSTSIAQTIISAAVFEGLTDRECAERLQVSHWLCTNRRREAKKTLTDIKVDLDLA